jgi:hypothetical protein
MQVLLGAIAVGEGISARSAFQRMVGHVRVYSGADLCALWSLSVDDINGKLERHTSSNL